MKPSLARISVAAVAMLVAGGCGSAASTDTSTRPANEKLSLAKTGARVGAADSASPALMPVQLTNYVLDGTLPDLGTQALVYRWTAHAVDIAAVNRLAEALGIDAPATATSEGFTASDSDATLTVYTYGGSAQVSYYPGGNAVDGSGGGSSGSSSPPSAGTGVAPDDPNSSTVNEKPAIDDPALVDPGVTVLPDKLTPPVDVPSADDAEQIARDLLDRMGVLDGAQWDTEVNDSGGIAVTCAVGEDCSGSPQYVTARDVTFALVIDGVRVSGIGWNVTIGEHRAVQSVYGDWGSATVLGTYDLRSTTSAFDALKNGDANYGGREPMAVDDAPVKAQIEPAPAVVEPGVAPPVDEPTGREPAVDPSGGDDPVVDTPVTIEPLPTEPVDPIDVHVTGVSLGLARWDAVDGNQNVIDLVPVYVFHTSVDGNTSDIEQLALDPAAIDFTSPIDLPVPLGEPRKLAPEPQPVPVPESSGGLKPAPSS